MTLICGHCGHRNRPETRFCTKCGTALEETASPPTPTCADCGAEIPEGKRFCSKCGTQRIQEAGPLPVLSLLCVGCGNEIAADAKFCSACGAPRADAKVEAKPPPPPMPPTADPPPEPVPLKVAPPASPSVAPGARHHSPIVALVSGVLVPGAGQSYNGKPFFGFLLLIFSPLLVPWVYGFVEAHQGARKIEVAGGRIGRGGWPWLGLHVWLAVDFTLFVLIVLTMKGVLS